MYSPPQQSSGTRHLVGALNTRKIGTKHHISLTKSADGGFGIKIAERDNMFGSNRPIYVTAITTTGSAFRDGRLKEGDMLLEVNGVDLAGKSQHEVTRTLKAVGVNETVDFVVSRQEDEAANSTGECDTNKSLIDLDVPDQEDQIEERIDNILSQYVFNIPLNEATQSAGLGLYLKYPTQNGKDLGIWIKNVITGGAAWKDGRLQPNDQILAINGINLVNLSNVDAYETLRAAVCRRIGPEALPNIIRLKIRRRGPENKTEHSDLLTNGHSKSYLCDNNSTNSPQTQASTSLKLSNSCNDKTNDSSSAISQITDFTSLPDKGGDDESIDATTEEERFQRDGFGRQSISEKRHAQLNAKNTDTYKRNQKMREEREKQRLMELQLERQRIADDKRFSLTLPSNMHRYSMSSHDHRLSVRAETVRAENIDVGHREVPVDVQLPVEQRHLAHEAVMFPRASTGRIARNRRINESFRAAVDRSYEGSDIYTASRPKFEFNEHTQRLSTSTKVQNSVAPPNSTNFSSDGESSAPPKKTSLLTKFLRFGSMKHDKKNKHVNQASFKPSEVKPAKELSKRDSETTRSPQNLHIQNHVQSQSMGVPNGCPPTNQWQLPPPHVHNGLWVLPVSDGSQLYHQNMYGTHNQHITHMHNHQPVPTIPHTAPFIPTINGQSSNGLNHHQPPILYGHAPTMTQQQIYDRQQQHIYYYDF